MHSLFNRRWAHLITHLWLSLDQYRCSISITLYSCNVISKNIILIKTCFGFPLIIITYYRDADDMLNRPRKLNTHALLGLL